MPGQELRNHRITAAGIAIVTACAAAVLYFGDPTRSGAHFPGCPLYTLTGIYCPGCGSTRALHELLHGQVAAAMSFNVLTVLALPFVLYSGLSYFVFAIRGRRLPSMHIPGRYVWAIGYAIVAFGILRNIPHYPFTLLAP